MSYSITQGRHAAHTSGNRAASSIMFGVIHDTENADPLHGDEEVATYFAGKGAGGSAHYVVDNDTITQTLPDTAVAWGAPPLNQTGIHIEQSGKAKFSTATWSKSYAAQLDRVAWLMATLSLRYDIPLRWLSTADLKRIGTSPGKGKGGWTRHMDVTAAFGKSTHVDPGKGWPAAAVMSKAVAYHTAMTAPKPGPNLTAKPAAKPAPKTRTVTVLVDGLALRKRASALSGSYGRVNRNTRLTLAGAAKGRWLPVKHGTGIAWIATRSLTGKRFAR